MRRRKEERRIKKKEKKKNGDRTIGVFVRVGGVFKGKNCASCFARISPVSTLCARTGRGLPALDT
jgi:hypothetical protein